MTVLLLQQRDEEFNTDDSADEDVVNNYCYMFATLNTPPDFKVIVLIIIDVFGLGKPSKNKHLSHLPFILESTFFLRPPIMAKY